MRLLVGVSAVAGVLLISSTKPAVAASSGGTVQQIKIEGAQRIEDPTILSYLKIHKGAPFDQDLLDKSLKDLFATGLFADVSLQRQGDTLLIKVVENPIINRIAFEGNTKRISDDILKSEIALRPRQVFTLTKVQQDTKKILDLYRVRGNFAATVIPKKIVLDQNRVDLVFEIDEGPVTSVRRIFFIGNKHFSDGKLESAIQTKESRWYRFFTSDDNYDADRLSYDRELLRKFYLEHGYADFKVNSSVAELSPNKEDFYITFTVEEGERYTFGKINVKNQLKKVNTKTLQDLITIKKDSWYNSKEVEKTVTSLTDALGSLGYAFVEVRPRMERDKKTHHINLTFEIKEGLKVYVDRVIIRGNDVTDEDVIRREMRVAEGDAYNTNRLKRSEQRIKDLGFFKKVSMTTEPGNQPDRVNVIIDVEEQSTGELSLAGGFSTADGILGDVKYTQHNFRGRGQELRTNFTISKKRRDFDFGFTEPYFLDRPLQAGFDVFNSSQSKYFEAPYDHHLYGTTLRLGYELADSLYQNLSYTVRKDKLFNLRSDASQYVREQIGTKTTSAIAQGIFYDQRDSKSEPTSGYYATFGNELAGLGGNVKYLKNNIGAGWFYPVMDEVVFGLSAKAGIMFGLGQKTRIVDRYSMGGDNLRGFDYGGVGPRDKKTSDPLGGTRFYSGTAEVTFPIGLPNEFGVKGAVFTDAGSAWKSGEADAGINDRASLRASAGVGLSWASPFGPLRIDLARPIKKEKYDKTRFFNFGFTTRF